MSNESLFTVEPDESGTRLDLYLVARLLGPSRSVIRRWILGGHVTVDGKTQKPGYSISAGETIRVVPQTPPPLELLPEAIPLEILFEDDALIVINKPAGLVVHPGAGNRTGTLANALLHHFKHVSKQDSIRPGIVHRLDKDTSGIMVIAKTESAHNALAQQFKERRVSKEYLALLIGHISPRDGVIDAQIGRHPRSRIRFSTRTRKPRQAVTRYAVSRYLQDFSYVTVFPETGRTHQIRVHFQHVGHPIVGDETYGRKAHQRIQNPEVRRMVAQLKRHFLHAGALAFQHPVTGEKREFRAALPGELARFLTALGE